MRIKSTSNINRKKSESPGYQSNRSGLFRPGYTASSCKYQTQACDSWNWVPCAGLPFAGLPLAGLPFVQQTTAFTASNLTGFPSHFDGITAYFYAISLIATFLRLFEV